MYYIDQKNHKEQILHMLQAISLCNLYEENKTNYDFGHMNKNGLGKIKRFKSFDWKNNSYIDDILINIVSDHPCLFDVIEKPSDKVMISAAFSKTEKYDRITNIVKDLHNYYFLICGNNEHVLEILFAHLKNKLKVFRYNTFRRPKKKSENKKYDESVYDFLMSKLYHGDIPSLEIQKMCFEMDDNYLKGIIYSFGNPHILYLISCDDTIWATDGSDVFHKNTPTAALKTMIEYSKWISNNSKHTIENIRSTKMLEIISNHFDMSEDEIINPTLDKNFIKYAKSVMSSNMRKKPLSPKIRSFVVEYFNAVKRILLPKSK